MKNLVVYYSRSGHNKKIAEELASLTPLRADLDSIASKKDYSGIIGWLRAGSNALKRKKIMINSSRNPLEYDLVIFGGPLWAGGNINNPLLSYLSNYKFKRSAFFSVSGNGNISTAMKQLQELGINPVATLSISDKELKKNEYKNKLVEFYKKIRQLK